MDPSDLKNRTKKFALRIIRLVRYLEKHGGGIGRILGDYQLLRSGTAVFANYRAACRAKSSKDFIAKLGTVAEEADETYGWLELLDEGGVVKHALIADLLREANELTAIMTNSRDTAIRRQKEKNLT